MTIESQLHHALAKMIAPQKVVVKAASTKEAAAYVARLFKQGGFSKVRLLKQKVYYFKLEVIGPTSGFSFVTEFDSDGAPLEDEGKYWLSLTVTCRPLLQFISNMEDALFRTAHSLVEVNIPQDLIALEPGAESKFTFELGDLINGLDRVKKFGGLERLTNAVTDIQLFGKVVEALAKNLPVGGKFR